MGKYSPETYKDPRWQKTRLRIFERDGWKCVSCGDYESPLHVHHVYYDDDMEFPWDCLDSRLITLCEDCHEDVKRLYLPKGDLLLDLVDVGRMSPKVYEAMWWRWFDMDDPCHGPLTEEGCWGPLI